MEFSIYYPAKKVEGRPHPMCPMGDILPFGAYTQVANVTATGIDDAFALCQNGVEGVSSPVFESMKLRSMAVGDLIKNHETGEIWYCDLCGWKLYDENLILHNTPVKSTF